MFGTILGRTGLTSVEAEQQLAQLRTDVFHHFLAMATLSYLAWHFVTSLTASTNREASLAYMILPVAAFVLLGSYILRDKNQWAAIILFLGGGLVAISWSLVVLETSHVAVLYAFVALAASFLVSSLGGVGVIAVSIGLLALLGFLYPGLIRTDDSGQTIALAGLAVGGVTVLRRHLVLTLNWYADSYRQAEAQKRDVQEHRAHLVQTLKQLDSAYYRLERANAALEIAWKAADEAERTKTQMAINISHELRTPLNLIAGFSEMMLFSPDSYDHVILPQPFWGDLNAVYRAAQHLLAFTDDILDLARIEVGTLGLTRDMVDLAHIVRDAVELMRDYVEAKGLQVDLRIPSPLAMVVADPLRIRQVLLNLLTNAARATEHGSITIHVVQEACDLRLTVIDTGPGIPPELLSQLFTEFVRSDTGKAGKPGGFGLGLSISKRFVELHGGKMGVESTLGVGTTFWFTLPVIAVDDVAPIHVPSRRAVPSRYGREPIVVLADPRHGLATILQRHVTGYRIEQVEDYLKASERAHELQAVAILVGPNTPGGLDFGSIPVLNCPLPYVGGPAGSVSAAEYLVKPISREILVRALKRSRCLTHRVLLVDDDERFVRMLRRMLLSEWRDAIIFTAYNGEEALRKMRDSEPDLVLLDLSMPHMDGHGVLKEMSVDPRLRDIKVIVVSVQGEIDATMPLGEEIHIRKPQGFFLGELTHLISSVIGAMTPLRSPHLSPPPVLPAMRSG